MDNAGLRVTVGTEGDEVVITLGGELDISTAPELWAAIDRALANDHVTLVLDLSQLGFVDSTGLGVFVRAGKELRAKGGTLVLRSPGERVAKLLALTRLEEVFEIR
ncbi:MAG: anti-sigma factor antagonist BldG [Acidimicrobiales bacterium]